MIHNGILRHFRNSSADTEPRSISPTTPIPPSGDDDAVDQMFSAYPFSEAATPVALGMVEE